MLAALLLLAAPLADEPRPSWQGVWQGTIGTLPVRACLKRQGPGYAFGSYYYLSRLQAIRLEQVGASKVWREGWTTSNSPPSPRWTFAAVGHDLLTGTWSNAGRTLPFRLTRLASGDDESPCADEAFNAPRWRPLAVTSRATVKDGVAYTKLTFHPGPAFPELELESFALTGRDPATRRINALLRAAVPGKDDDWRSCISSGLEAHGIDGDLQESLAPTLITARWLAASLDIGSDCGGAHPNSNSTPLLFDRTTGKAVALNSWLNDAALDRTDGADLAKVRPALRRAIIARAGAIEAECREAIDDAEFWDAALDRAGLSFTPQLAHVEQACADTTLVPWSGLAQFLSSAGTAGRASLIGNRR